MTVKDGKLLWHCLAGCTQEAVKERFVADGLWSRPRSSKGSFNRKERERLDGEGKVDFREILDACIAWPELDKEQRQILENYARSRGVKMPETAMLLPSSKSNRLTDRRFPAMVFGIAREGESIGAHLTWLSSKGHSKLAVDDPKRTYGGVKGGHIRLHRRYDRLEPIVVAEGIETALSVERITGLQAIVACNAGNLGKINVPKCSEVIIAADNDPNRSGIQGATNLARRLSSEGRPVRIALPYSHGNKKRDWNDELCAPDADIDLLNKQILEARQYDVVGAVSASRFLKMDFPPRPSMLHPWLPTAGLAMVHAPRGAAKTWFCLSAAHAVVTGKTFIDWEVHTRGRVLYVDGELPASVLQTRLRHFDWEGYSSNLLILTPDLFHRRNRSMPDLGSQEGRDHLDATIEQRGIDLIILDSLSTLQRSGGEENAAESWINIQHWALKHRGQGRSIIFVHHEGRNNKPRGTSKREDTLDTMIGLTPMNTVEGNDCTTMQLEFTKHRGFFGRDTAPRVLQLSTETKRAVWTAGRSARSTRDRVLDLKDRGIKAADIARELGITPGRVSQILNESPEERTV